MSDSITASIFLFSFCSDWLWNQMASNRHRNLLRVSADAGESSLSYWRK
jgi:hypothetical protein